MEFTVHLWHETVERISLASTPGPEQLCNVFASGMGMETLLSPKAHKRRTSRGICKTLPRVTPSENSAYAAVTYQQADCRPLAATNLGGRILMITINQSFGLSISLKFYPTRNSDSFYWHMTP